MSLINKGDASLPSFAWIKLLLYQQQIDKIMYHNWTNVEPINQIGLLKVSQDEQLVISLIRGKKEQLTQFGYKHHFGQPKSYNIGTQVH